MEKYSIILTVLFVMKYHYQISAEMTENRNISQQPQQWRSPVQTESQPNANNTLGHPSAAEILLETAPNGRPLRLQSITQQQKQARASTAAAFGQQNVQPTMEYSNQMQTTTYPRLQIQVQAPATGILSNYFIESNRYFIEPRSPGRPGFDSQWRCGILTR